MAGIPSYSVVYSFMDEAALYVHAVFQEMPQKGSCEWFYEQELS